MSGMSPPPAPSWFPDELVHAGRENLDAEHVARYDDKEDAGAAAEIALLCELGFDADSVVVEFGPGTGQFTVAAAPQCERIVAVDVSAVMLDRLQRKVAGHRLDNVEVVQAGFLTYAHTGAPADIVYSRLALHHLPDFWKVLALDRLRQVVRPGGVVRLWDVVYHFEPQETEERIEAWCETAGDEIEGEWSRAELEEHVRDEHSTFTWLLEAMITRCGFDIAQAEYSDDGIFAGYALRAT